MNVTFTEIYNDYKQMVWNTVARFAPVQQDREDLFQEVFLKIHRSLKSFRQEASLKTWVYRITVNTSMSFLKKKKRQEILFSTFSLFKTFTGDQKYVKLDEEIFKPLGKLNPRQRMILLLSDIEEHTLEEIGEILEIPVGTVKSNLHRARSIVKKELEKNG